MTNPTNPAACDHEYRTANMSGERVARCLKCGEPEPIRARPNLGKLIVGVAKGEYPSGSTVDLQGNISPPTNPADGDVVTHDSAAEALDSLDDFARMDCGADATGPRGTLERYIAQQRAKEAKQSSDQGSGEVDELIGYGFRWKHNGWIPNRAIEDTRDGVAKAWREQLEREDGVIVEIYARAALTAKVKP